MNFTGPGDGIVLLSDSFPVTTLYAKLSYQPPFI